MNNKLLQQLNEQGQNLTELLEAASLQQRALIENNLSGMHIAVRKEEALLNEMNKCQKRIVEAIKEFAEENGIKIVKPKLTELLTLINQAEEENHKLLAEAITKIKELSKKISRLNFQNKLLISQSRAFIKGTIAELTEQGGKNILDKRM